MACMVSPAALPSARARRPDRSRRPPPRPSLEPAPPHDRAAHAPGVGESPARARGHAAERRARCAPEASLRSRARALGRAARPRDDRERPRCRHRTARDQPLRRAPRADARDAGRARRARGRPPGRRRALLHVPVDAGPRHARLRAGGRRGRRARPAQPARRRRRRGQRAGSGLRVVRRPLPAARAAGPHARRARALARARARARRPAQRRRNARLAARDAVGGHRRAVGGAVAEHADARHRARLSRWLSDRRHEPLGGAGDDAALRVGRRALPRRARLRDGPRRARLARRGLPARALHADLPQVGGAALRRRADPRHRPRDVQAVPDRARGDPRRASPPPAALRVEASALRVRALAAADRHPARHRPDPSRARARWSPARDRARLDGRPGALATATGARAGLPVTAVGWFVRAGGFAQFVKSRVKKFFTLEPNASALSLMLPSLRCAQALLAGGFAAWPDSLSFSPLNLAPSTTVWPMPLAVSSTPVPSLPSPIFFAPVSTSRVADLTFDSSAAVAGAAIQPIRAASAIATASSLLLVMVGCLLVSSHAPGYRGASPAEGPATQRRRSGRLVDNRASGWPAGITASWPSRTTGSCCSIIQTSPPAPAARAEPRPSRTEASTSQIAVTMRTAASSFILSSPLTR